MIIEYRREKHKTSISKIPKMRKNYQYGVCLLLLVGSYLKKRFIAVEKLEQDYAVIVFKLFQNKNKRLIKTSNQTFITSL